jgi:ABC-2 type transport system permease protein
MTVAMNPLSAAFVIGRRDYGATVFSKAFVFFLIGPLFPILLGVLFGSIGASVASEGEVSRIAVRASPAELARLEAARRELAALPALSDLPLLVAADPAADPSVLLADTRRPVAAVLSDPFGHPQLTGAIGGGDPLVGRISLILSRAKDAAAPLPDVQVVSLSATAGSVESARAVTARAGQALLFLLTLLLAGMLLSQLIEEKSNKVIEVLAAAVPVTSIFLGKLFAMLCVSLTGILVWTGAALLALWLLLPGEALAALPPPAVGWPVFALLGAAYFAMSYLLIGAAFLGIGAQASTVREVQTLSMPVTMAQVGLFALSSFAVGNEGPGALVAALFPLSSPFAMMARAALDPAILPHLAALAWQALWVSLILKLAAAWFRRSVLNGPGARGRWWARKRDVAA